jgi:preprotein translocase SecE subunit
MAKPAKKPRLRKTETVRERSGKQTSLAPKNTRFRKTAKAASTPFRLLGRLFSAIGRPFRFILWPFKTRPVRFTGRWLARLLLITYFWGAWQELRQVTWPDRKETRQLTVAVFVFAIIFSALITAVDYGLDKVFKNVLLK